MNPYDSNPVMLLATGIHYQIAENVLIDRQDLILREGERVALVGRNGCGKSSLMRILAGTEQFFQGDISTRKRLRAAYLPQEVDLTSGATVKACILEGASELMEMIHEFEHAEGRRQQELEDTINRRNGWDLENSIKTLASALELPPLERITDTLSGGEKRRVGLAKVLLDPPDLLLLDEPTNHLDAQTISWLEDFLPKCGCTCLVVTHDRYFLDKVATRIVELSYGRLYSYDGNYSSFLQKKAERISDVEAAEAKRLAFIRRELDWIRRGPKARGTKSQARIDRFEAAANQDPLKREQSVELLIPPAPPVGNIICNLDDVTLEIGGKRLFSHLTLSFTAGMRLGVVGRNGLGKTSLLRLLLGELQPTSGSIRIGERVRFNYSDQHRVILHDEKTVFEEVGEGNEFVMFDNRKMGLWGYLRNYLFQDNEINSQVGKLSGGERNRLVLAILLKRGGNFLLLDEPTNDLDLATLRILEEALVSFGGNLAVVSHDRYFLNRVCTHILAFEDDGTLTFTPGDYTYYEEKKRERAAACATEVLPSPRKQEPQRNRPPSQKLKWAEQKELEAMEDTIAAAEEEVASLEALFTQPDFHQKYGRQTAELTAKLQTAKDKVSQLYARWEELEQRNNQS
ncbi:MAG: ATP-binding cassette domain-containing protein [Victivallales bacterium]|nr:ATP-binding cassette domain-containing protein [Victivallales bacterium]